MDYAKALKIVRAVRNISQQELAERVGLSKSLLSRIESGERSLSADSLRKISQKLSIPEKLIVLLASKPGHKSKLTEQDVVKFGEGLLRVLHDIDA